MVALFRKLVARKEQQLSNRLRGYTAKYGFKHFKFISNKFYMLEFDTKFYWNQLIYDCKKLGGVSHLPLS